MTLLRRQEELRAAWVTRQEGKRPFIRSILFLCPQAVPEALSTQVHVGAELAHIEAIATAHPVSTSTRILG